MTPEADNGPFSPPVRAIGYLRVSMAREDMISPEIQKASISDYAARTGRQVVLWISDLDATGRNFRRKVMTAIGHVEAGEASEIIVYRYDRWGRNAAGAMANIARVTNAGGHVASATEPFDAETAIGRYSRTNALALAEMQSDIIGEGWRAALSRRVQLGLPATGNARFGYLRLGRVPDSFTPHRYHRDPHGGDERYVPDPETGPVLRGLYERFIGGTGTTRLLGLLAEQGITTLRGQPFSVQTLTLVLDSGFAAGLLKVHDVRCGCRQPSRCKRVTFLPGAHEPLITAEQWEAYQRRRNKMREVPPRSRVAAYPLTSLIFCGTCDGPLIATWANGERGFAYRCNRWVQHQGCSGVWVRRSVAEAAVLGKLREWSGEVDTALAVTRRRARVAADAELATRRLTADLAKADRELVQLVKNRAADETMPAAIYEQAKAELLAGRDRAERALAAASRLREVTGRDHRPVVRELLANWRVMTPARKRDVLSGLISRVVVTRTGYRTPADIRVIPAWEEGE